MKGKIVINSIVTKNMETFHQALNIKCWTQIDFCFCKG